MPPHETPGAADAAERICAWAEKLDDLGRSEEARRVLLEALDGPCDSTPVALALARLETRAGAADRAAELLTKVLGDDPGNVRAARMLATALLNAGKADEATAVLSDAVSRTGTADRRELAEFSGVILRALGRHAEAVAVFGPPATLSRYGRRLRRRSWWRSGGPLHRRSGGAGTASVAAPATAPPSAPDPPDAVLEAVAWAKWLRGEGRHDDARKVVSEALAAHGRHLALLVCAAEIEFDVNSLNTSAHFWREAYAAAPHDVDVTCGLAKCLVRTLVSQSATFRVNDALRVLDGFPDQSHPKIRAARADALEFNDAPAARVVAAYGPADGLRSYDAQTRRRLWWRSAGPLGQLALRVADRVRGPVAEHPEPDSLSRTQAESEAVARVLDAVRELPPPAVRERIEEAMREHGRQPSLLLAYAQSESADRVYWHRLALAAEAARSSKGSLEAICGLTWAVNAVFGYGSALQVLASLPDAARRTGEARAVTGNLHQISKNFALAVAAYGDPRDLDDYYRKFRRRALPMALVQRLLPVSRGDVAAIDPLSFDPVPPAIARILDRGARSSDPAEIVELYRTAIDEHGRHPRLLLEFATVERRHGDRDVCAALAAEAIAAAPDDPLVVSDGVRELWLVDRDADALRALDERSEDLTKSPAFCQTAGEVYQYWQLWAHAYTAFGRNGLQAQWWRRRRRCWWRTGGPIGPIRSLSLRLEGLVLSVSALPARPAAALSMLSLPAALADAVRGELATYRMSRTFQVVFLARRLDAWVARIGAPIGVVIVFAATALAERLRWPSDGIADPVTVAAFGTVAAVVALLLVRRYVWRRAARLGIVVVCAAGAAVLLSVSERTAFAAGSALAALTCMIVVAFGLPWILRAVLRRSFEPWRRRRAETGVLNDLLLLIGELSAPRQRRVADKRGGWMDDLEGIANTVERDLPFALPGGDRVSQSTITAHARSAAAALRDMKRAVAMPDEASWRTLIERLTGLAAALARHDFANWPPPAPEATDLGERRPPWRQAVTIVRTLLVIFVPPLVAFLPPLHTSLPGPALSWLRFVAVMWALLGAVTALEPAWGDRIAKMSQGLEFMRKSMPSKTEAASPASPGAADAAPQQDAGAGRWPPARASSGYSSPARARQRRHY